MTPIQIFEEWLNEEMASTKVRIPTACCLSTNGIDGFPNARFVSLKDIIDGCFIITGPLSSRKGVEINNSDQVALTFWWTETERQVRIQGKANKISGQLADRYFRERPKDSQIVSILSKQGQEIRNLNELANQYEQLKCSNEPLNRPKNWGGYSISPLRIEFLEFKPTRFHQRKLFEFSDGNWTVKQLQP